MDITLVAQANAVAPAITIVTSGACGLVFSENAAGDEPTQALEVTIAAPARYGWAR